ncbi:MAG: T9SS type A sorting domain-containing protein [Bacteroidetes bacterium]|nr:T9SS type A sorting domain-containing protein [Bacteroidota bacterium]
MKKIVTLCLLLFYITKLKAQSVQAGWFLTSDTVQCLSNNSFFGDDTSKVSNGGNYNKTWYYGDGDSCHCIHANHSYKLPGRYEIKLLIENNGLYDSMSHYVTVLANAKPYFSIDYFSVCRGNSFTLVDTVTNTYGAKRLWDWGDGNFDTSKIAKHIYSSANLYIPMLKYIYTNGCNDSNDSYTLEVFPNILASIQGQTKESCQDGAILNFNLLIDADTGISSTFHWNSLQGKNDTSAVYSFNTSNSGHFLLTMFSIASNGCSSKDSIMVNIYKQPHIDWTWAPAVLCKGDTIALSTQGSMGYSGFDSLFYSYSLNGQIIHEDTSAIFRNIIDSGLYKVYAHNRLCIDSTSEHLLKVTIPIKSTITKAGDTLIASEGVNYNWYLNGLFLSGFNNQKVIPSSSGNYTVWVTDSNFCGLVSDPMNISLSVGSNLQNKISLYPNPIAEHLYIQLNTPSTFEYTIFNSAGMPVKSGISTNSVYLDTKDLSDGLYFIRVTLDHKIYTSKFTKI